MNLLPTKRAGPARVRCSAALPLRQRAPTRLQLTLQYAAIIQLCRACPGLMPCHTTASSTSGRAAGWRRRARSTSSWRSMARSRCGLLLWLMHTQLIKAAGVGWQSAVHGLVCRRSQLQLERWPALDTMCGTCLSPSPHISSALLQVPVDAKKLMSEAAAAAAGQPKKRGPRPTRKEAEENAVRRVRATSLSWWQHCCGVALMLLIGRGEKAEENAVRRVSSSLFVLVTLQLCWRFILKERKEVEESVGRRVSWLHCC